MTESQHRIDSLLQSFAQLESWEDKYKKLIEIGKTMPVFPEEHRTDKNKVQGCQSQVWLHAELKDGRVYFYGDSDALFVKGLVALLLKIYSGLSLDEVISVPPDFLKLLGFEANLTPSRSNGLIAMIRQIKNYAVAFKYLQAMK